MTLDQALAVLIAEKSKAWWESTFDSLYEARRAGLVLLDAVGSGAYATHVATRYVCLIADGRITGPHGGVCQHTFKPT